MSLSQLIRSMAAAGATPEAIALAVEAIEARDATIEARRVAERDRKRRQRAGQSRDSHGTVTGQFGTVTGQSRDNPPLKERSPPIPPSKENNPPRSLSSLRSESEPRAGRASASEAKEAAQEFERFWQVWPNKIGKPAAAKAYFKVWRETEAIIAGVNRYMRDKPADRPWLNPSTFLNQRRWEDDPAPVANARGSPAREETSGVAKLLAEAYGIDRRNGTQAAGDFTDIRALPVTHVGVGTADYGDDGGIFGGLRRPDG